MYDVRPLNERFGAVVRARPGVRLDDLETEAVWDLLAADGAVLFTGFPPDLRGFATFAARFGRAHSAHIHHSPDRDVVEIEGFESGTVQSASYGHFGLNPHSEASYSPMRPDLIWFYCEMPPAAAGRTTLCDGIDLLGALGDEARREFAACTLAWRWEIRVRDLEEQLRLPFERLAAEWFDPNPHFTYALSSDRSEMRSTYRTPAVPETLLQGRSAFANSLLGFMSVYRRPNPEAAKQVAPGLSGESLAEAMALAHERSHAIDWRPGDIALVDNTRVMHGREPFADGKRRILVQTMKAER